MSSNLFSAGPTQAQDGSASSIVRKRSPQNDALRLAWSLRPRATFCDARDLPDAETIATADAEARALAIEVNGRPLARIGRLAGRLAAPVKATMPRAVSLTDLPRIGQCDIDTHDAFFGILRCRGFNAWVLYASQASALALLHKDLRDSATRLTDERLRLLEQGLRLCIGLSTGAPVPAQDRPFSRSAAEATIVTSVRRWLRGHHMFAVLSQGLILCFTDVARFHARGETAGTIAAADAAAFLLKASAASLELTGDMPPAHYNDVVRNAMAPPIMPPGFSGLHSRDHRHLVKCMKDAKDALEALKATHPDVYARIPAALTEVYDSHKLVCSAFLGNSEKSLLMAANAQASGADQLENFKRSRLRMIGAHGQKACA